ncbi:MAG: transglycosylase SLT domain-containing protein [Gemmatimonadota bacterium]
MRADSVALASTTVVPDSVNVAMMQAIAQVSALFDVPDSVVRGYASNLLVDVDSTSHTGDDAEATWDIDVDSYVTQKQVARYVDLFLGSSRTRFVERLQRGKQYEPMIRETFRAAGIPEDMYFLALVESGYETQAYSRAAAVGMWQFMSSTARGVGLRVDWWVDERRDPVKSTGAAARFIRDLQGQFGSLYLAAAAYNGGPGRVSRGLKKFDDELGDVTGEDCFFALAEQDYLRAETKNYVPQLIAAALLGKAPSRYGLVVDSVARFAFDTVVVPPSTPLAAVAKAVGATTLEVQNLNGQILRGVTPPDSKVTLRVPEGTGSQFEASFATLDSADRQGFTKIKTRKGETFASIAKRHDLQTRQLQWYNRTLGAKKGRLSVGQTVLIPSAAVVDAAREIPDPSIERYGTSAAASGSGRTTHVVRRGETLGAIAQRYHTSVSTLVRLNGLKRSVIYPGQSIIVRGSTSARSSTTRKASASRSAASSKSSAKQGSTSSARKSPAKKAVAKKSVVKPASAKLTTAKKSKAPAGTS